MNQQEIDSLLSQAEKAYKKKDKRKSTQLINQILQQDFSNASVWDLLYKLFGANQDRNKFQIAFTKKFYPEKLSLFEDHSQNSIESSQKKIEKLSTITPVTPPKPSHQPPVTNERVSSPAIKPSLRKSSSSKLTPVKPILKRPGDKISIIIVEDSSQTRENIIRSLRFQENIEVIGSASSGAEGIQIARELQPDVIIMDISMPDMDGITATESVKKIVPFSQVIILTVRDDIDYIRRAMMAGARDYLSKPLIIDELVSAIQRAGEIAFQERQKTTTIDEALSSGEAASKGKIIAVYSPKGGVGTTMFASNLAVAFYDEDSAVALIDGNLQFGDVPVFFNAQSNKSTLDLTNHIDELSEELVEETLFQHDSGIRLLPPPNPEEAEMVTEEQFSNLLGYLRGEFSYIIVDTTHDLTETTIAAIKTSDIFILITTQDIPSIARARRFLDFFYTIESNIEKILLVLNQYDKRIGITEEKVSKVLNLEISAILPMDKATVIPSINRGSPFMLQPAMISKPIAKEILHAVEKSREKITQLEKAAQAEGQ